MGQTAGGCRLGGRGHEGRGRGNGGGIAGIQGGLGDIGSRVVMGTAWEGGVTAAVTAATA